MHLRTLLLAIVIVVIQLKHPFVCIPKIYDRTISLNNIYIVTKIQFRASFKTTRLYIPVPRFEIFKNWLLVHTYFYVFVHIYHVFKVIEIPIISFICGRIELINLCSWNEWWRKYGYEEVCEYLDFLNESMVQFSKYFFKWAQIQ